ncbi:MAG TPA: hypothetical protein VIY51_09220 [Xanthobacteraceae bacterium]
MRPHRAYLLGSAIALITLALAAGLQVLPVAASPHAGTPATATPVNRILKGDRLPVAAPADVQGLKVPAVRPRLPEGCEATVSSMTRSSLAQTPARCLS